MTGSRKVDMCLSVGAYQVSKDNVRVEKIDMLATWLKSNERAIFPTTRMKDE